MVTFREYVAAIPQRYILTLMVFLAIVNVIMMRSCLSLALTQMVLHKPDTGPMDEYTCPANEAMTHSNGTHESQTTQSNQFDWSEQMQGVILGSFYIGYVIMHVPAALLAERIGAKYIIVASLFLTATFSLLTPIAVELAGAPALIVLRIFMGIFQGGVFPAVSTILSAWVPVKERGLLGSLVFNGLPFGAIIGNFFSGIILHQYRNWHILFYAFGVSGISLAVLFTLICSSSPISHPFITDRERNYLKKELGQLERDKNIASPPWKAIFKNGPVIALIIAGSFGDWSYFVLMIDLPKYMNDVLHVSIQENGVYSSVPWALRIIISFIGGYWSDWLISTGRISITNARKLFVLVSSVIDATFIIAASYAGCDAMLVGLFFTIAVGAQGFHTASTMVNPMDLSPNFSGTITGIANGIGSCTGIMVPYIIGVLTPNSLASEWRVVFWITFFVHVAKITIYTVWGSGKVQTWNSAEEETEERRADDNYRNGHK